MKLKPTLWTYAALAFSLLAWASAFAGIRASLRAYEPGHLILLRFVVASFLLLIYAVLTQMRMPEPMEWRTILLLGFAGFTVYQAGLVFGEVTVSAGAASLLAATAPIFTSLVAFYVLRERLRATARFGIGLGFLGVVLIVLGEGEGIDLDVGAFLVLLSAISESFYFVFQKPYLEKYRPIEFATYTIWAGALFMLVFVPGLWRAVRLAPLSATLGVVYLGVVTILAFAAWNTALARMAVSVATSFLYLLPVLAIIISWFWLGELPTVLSVVGGTIALLGVAAANWQKP